MISHMPVVKTQNQVQNHDFINKIPDKPLLCGFELKVWNQASDL